MNNKKYHCYNFPPVIIENHKQRLNEPMRTIELVKQILEENGLHHGWPLLTYPEKLRELELETRPLS